MKICLEIHTTSQLVLTHPIKLEQHEDRNKLFRVTYGKQVRDHLLYDDAATELGACLMHALACEGLLDNGE